MRVQFIEFTPEQLSDLISNTVLELINNKNLIPEPFSDCQLKELNTPKETAEYFGVTKPCLHSWNEKGIIKSHKVGGRVYYRRADILELTTQKKG